MRLLIYLEPTSYLLDLWRELKASGAGNDRLVFVGENLSQSWNIDLAGDPAIRVLKGSGPGKFLQLMRMVQACDIRLVHLAGWGGAFLLGALVTARLRGLPVTVESDTAMHPGTRGWKRFIKRVLYPWLFKLPSLFLPAGGRQAAYLRSHGVTTDRIRVAQMTVDVEAMSRHAHQLGSERRAAIRVALGLPANAVVFLYVGRHEPHKGLHELLDAFRGLAGKGASMALALVGDGSMMAEVQSYARTDRRVFALGRRSGLPLWDVYCAADVLVLPSRFEPWGLVVNEAMAFGLPVVVTSAVGCADDLVPHLSTGLVVTPGSAIELRNAMAALVDNEHLRLRLASNARSLIAQWTLAREALIIAGAWRQLECC